LHVQALLAPESGSSATSAWSESTYNRRASLAPAATASAMLAAQGTLQEELRDDALRVTGVLGRGKLGSTFRGAVPIVLHSDCSPLRAVQSWKEHNIDAQREALHPAGGTRS
jgi:hypothetical protein